jgi:hypothetical protein
MMNSASAGAGDSKVVKAINFTYKTAVITFSGTDSGGTTQCTIQISIDNEHWVTAKNKDDTNAIYTANGYFESDESFQYIRANNTAAFGRVVRVDFAANK